MAAQYYRNGQTIKVVLGEEYRFDNKEYSSFKIQKRQVAIISRMGVLSTRKAGETRLSFKDRSDNHYHLRIVVLPRIAINMKGSFPILAWYSLQEDLSRERFVELSDAGFNLSFSYATDSIVPQMARALRNAKGTGVRLIIPFNGTWVDVKPIVNRFKEFDELWGWYIADEPTCDKLDGLRGFNDKVRLYDNNHPFYVNLFPTYADSSSLGGSYEDYVINCIKHFNPSFLSFDHYPMTYRGVRKDFYKNLAIISDIARDYMIPFWAFACSVKYSGGVPAPKLEHLKLEVYTALAFGAQGIQYFTYTTPRDIHGGKHFWNAPLDKNFQKTQTYYWVKEVNARIRSVEKYFMGAEVESIGYLGEKELNGMEEFSLRELPDCIDTISCSGTVIVSKLSNSDKRLLVVVSTDHEWDISFRLNCKEDLKKLSYDGQFVSASPLEVLKPGEMLVYTY